MNFANTAFSVRGVTGMRFMLMATLAAGMLSMNAGRGTLAFFTTQVTSTGNTFTAGSLRFTLTDNSETSQAVTTSLTNVNIAPTKFQQDFLTLNNTGTLDANYGLAIATEQVGSDLDLSPALKLTVRKAVAGTSGSCKTDDITDSAKWASIGVDKVSLPANGTAAQTVIDATNATQAQALAAPVAPATSNSQVLCVKVEFPDTLDGSGNPIADNTYNSQNPLVKYSTNIDFTFNGLVS